MIALLADRFTVIAPDTPGNGLSDPLPIDEPTMEDFADAVIGFLDVLGIDAPLPVYGYHTGGLCALALAVRSPERVTIAVLNGYLQLDEAERSEFLQHYLPPFVPEASGAHLAWAWSRFRDQYLFFPWYRADAGHRLKTSLPPPPYIQTAIMDFMRAGDNYRRSYRTAFTYDTERAVQAAIAPVAILSADTDLIAEYVERLPSLPRHVSVRRCPDGPSALAEAVRVIERAPSPSSALTQVARKTVPAGIRSEYVTIGGHQCFVRRAAGEGRPILFVHELGQSSLSVERLMRPLVGKRPLIAVDLLGHGESDDPYGASLTLDQLTEQLAASCSMLAGGPVDVVSEGAGSLIAAALAVRAPALVAALAMVDGWAPTGTTAGREAPDLTPDATGSHWLRAWHCIRQGALFNPWFDPTRERSRTIATADLDPALLQQRAVDLFKAAEVHAPLVARLVKVEVARLAATSSCRIVLLNGRGDFPARVQDAAGGRATRSSVEPEPNAIAAAVLDFFAAG